MKTKDLIGPALDWAVAKCLGYSGEQASDILFCDSSALAYSTDWAQSGPIIESERINVDPSPDSPEWYGYYDHSGKWFSGPTPLVAAMRCYVSYQLGDEVEVPEELK